MINSRSIHIAGCGIILFFVMPEWLSDQCKEIEENNRMGKTRDLFKEIRATKGIFHAKMGTIKDRNATDIQKQKVLKRGGKNT